MLKSVARFVAQMHAIPIAKATAAGIGPSDTNRDATCWRTFYADLTTTLYPHLMRDQRDYVDHLFDPVLNGALTFDHHPTLVYGDLASSHLLVDPSERRLAAVIDFGTAGIGDRAVDIAALLHVFGSRCSRPTSTSTTTSTRRRCTGHGSGAPPSTCNSPCWGFATATSACSSHTSEARRGTCGRSSAVPRDDHPLDRRMRLLVL